MADLYIYTTPAASDVTLRLDDGRTLNGVPCVAHGRDDAHRLTLPGDAVGQGGVLHVTATGYLPFENRGIVNVERACFELDDVHLAVEPPPPERPTWNPDLDPRALIQAVYEQGDFDLATKQGCGEYTEACCRELFAQQSPLWSHVKKTGAQNQWNGHAVDAVQLLAKAGSTDAGIYDIIWSCESPEAEPAWSYKGPPDPNLWMPPV